MHAIQAVPGSTVSRVEGVGRLHGEMAATPTFGRCEMAKVELVVPDGLADRVITAIEKAARTGRPGDGKVFVVRVEEVRNGDCPCSAALGKNAIRTSSDVGGGLDLTKMTDCSGSGVGCRRCGKQKHPVCFAPGMLKRPYPVCIQCCREDYQRRRPRQATADPETTVQTGGR